MSASSAAFAASDLPIASETAGAHGAAWFDLFASLARQAEATQEDFASLQRELTQLESDAVHLRGERDGALREVARLEQTLAERTAQLAGTEEALVRARFSVGALAGRVAGLESELRGITSSTAWRLLSRYRAGINWLLPAGSRARQLYLAAVHGRRSKRPRP